MASVGTDYCILLVMTMREVTVREASAMTNVVFSIHSVNSGALMKALAVLRRRRPVVLEPLMIILKRAAWLPNLSPLLKERRRPISPPSLGPMVRSLRMGG